MKKLINCLVAVCAVAVLFISFAINGRFIPVVAAFTDIRDLPSETTSPTESPIVVDNTAETEGILQPTIDNADLVTETEVEEQSKEIVGIEIDTSNIKSVYNAKEEFNAEGLTVYAVYSDETQVPLNHDEYTVSDVNTSKYGTHIVTVEYGDFADCFEVEVVYLVSDVEAYDRYTSSELNLRNGPSTQFDIVATMPLNSVVHVIGEVDNGWAKVIYGDYEGYCSANYLSETKTQIESNNKPSSKPATNGPFSHSNDSGIFIVESGVNDDVIDRANYYWSKTPNWLRQKFMNSGWKVVISGTNLSARFGYSYSIAGLTVSHEKTIYLDNRTRAVDRAFVHELVHFLDHEYGWVSTTEEFTNIFYAERYSYADVTGIGDGHDISNVKEYFASVVSDIILYGESSIGNIPETYNYVINYMH